MATDLDKSQLHGIHRIEDIEQVVRALVRPTPEVARLEREATYRWAAYDAKHAEAEQARLYACEAEDALLRAVKEGR